MKKSQKTKPSHSPARHRFAAALILFLLSAALLLVSTLVPAAAEWYSSQIYQPAAAAISGLTGRVPFSLAEIGLYLLILGFLLSAVYTIRRIIKKGNAGQRLLSWLSGILLPASLLAFFFMLGGGINYHRVSFAETAGISAEPCTAEDLSRICSWLTEEVNVRSAQVSRDENGVMSLSRPEGPDAAAAMKSLGETFPDLSGSYPMPKKVLCSQILSRLGLTGIFSAFTIEANYNRDMTAYNIPFTVCHELSHLRIYAGRRGEFHRIPGMHPVRTDSLSVQRLSVRVDLLHERTVRYGLRHLERHKKPAGAFRRSRSDRQPGVLGVLRWNTGRNLHPGQRHLPEDQRAGQRGAELRHDGRTDSCLFQG